MPDALLARLPGCIWVRWGWDFFEDGRLVVSTELLCRAPPELGALDVTFTDVVPGAQPNRPAELTLLLSTGGHMRLRAVDDPNVSYGAIIDRIER